VTQAPERNGHGPAGGEGGGGSGAEGRAGDMSGGVAGGLLRSSAVMAAGTLASRATGFLRTAALVAALGTQGLGDAYNVSYQIPFTMYDLLLGGILVSVIVPLIVRVRERSRDVGAAYEQRLLSLAVLVLGTISAAGVLLAPWLISLYGGGLGGPERDLAVSLTRFFLPQLLFFGIGAFGGAILNVRGRFGAPMWMPVINNIVVVGVAVTFIVIALPGVGPATITAGEVRLLGAGTTAGIVAQTLGLLVALRAAGFRWRPRLDFRAGELSEIGRMAGWTMVYVLTTQAALVVVTNLATRAGRQGRLEGLAGVGFAPYFNAYQLFQLPYAIVAVSVITALLPRMSVYAAERRLGLVRAGFSIGLRLAAVLLIPGAMLLFVLGADIATVAFAHHNTSVGDALVIAGVLRGFAVALVPFAAFQLMLRVFYALGDTRTPALLALLTAAVNVGLDVAAFALLPTGQIIVGLAYAFGAGYLACALAAWWILRGRTGGLDGRRVLRVCGLLTAAAFPGFVAAYALRSLIDALWGGGMLPAIISLAAATAAFGLLYVQFAQVLRIAEVESLRDDVWARRPAGFRRSRRHP
jgi:putative peptidoglycan lipid II flippase